HAPPARACVPRRHRCSLARPRRPVPHRRQALGRRLGPRLRSRLVLLLVRLAEPAPTARPHRHGPPQALLHPPARRRSLLPAAGCSRRPTGQRGRPCSRKGLAGHRKGPLGVGQGSLGARPRTRPGPAPRPRLVRPARPHPRRRPPARVAPRPPARDRHHPVLARAPLPLPARLGPPAPLGGRALPAHARPRVDLPHARQARRQACRARRLGLRPQPLGRPRRHPVPSPSLPAPLTPAHPLPHAPPRLARRLRAPLCPVLGPPPPLAHPPRLWRARRVRGVGWSGRTRRDEGEEEGGREARGGQGRV
ncbi:uncharacterized protein RHOBADRAFT_53482, partial [Rhodotorula graminis WP1]